MNAIFFNEYGRLRSGWRFGLFLSLFLALFLALAGAAGLLLQNVFPGLGENRFLARIMGSLIGLFLAITVGWFCGKYFEGLPFRALGAWFTQYWFKDLILGLVIGVLSIGLAVLIAVGFGDFNFSYNESSGSSAVLMTLGTSLVIFVFGAAFEEALVRGYMLQTLARANLGWLAIILTSLFFAAGHLGNPASNLFSTVNTALAGVWLGVAYLKTRTLWLVFGLHFAWNWVMGAFFGIEVSGLTELTPAPLLTELDSGPKWITGGDYGLEGGIAATAAIVISTVAIWFLPVLKPADEMMELTSRELPTESFPSKPKKPNTIET
jgi:membrane protease YdiL (CAAX protease family)